MAFVFLLLNTELHWSTVTIITQKQFKVFSSVGKRNSKSSVYKVTDHDAGAEWGMKFMKTSHHL